MIFDLDIEALIIILTAIVVPVAGFIFKMVVEMRHRDIKIEDITSRIADIPNLEKKISSIESDLRVLNTKFEELRNVVDRVKNYILDHKTEINGLSAKDNDKKV